MVTDSFGLREGSARRGEVGGAFGYSAEFMRKGMSQSLEEQGSRPVRDRRVGPGAAAKGGLPEEVLDNSDPRVVLLRELTEFAGVALYDVTFPRGSSGVLQVLISPAASPEIGHDECSRLARLILDSERVEELLPGSATLEVSSPGINRALRSVVQLRGAVGERVRISAREYRSESSQETFGAAVIRGTLQQVADEHLRMNDDSRKEVVVVSLKEVKEARVDFAFNPGSSKPR